MEEQGGNFFVKRPIVAMVIAIIMVIVGTISLMSLPSEQYPNITPPIVQVRTTYTGASSLTVEESLATPLEQEINGVENMLYMKSTNSNDGTLTIDVSFDVGTDPDMSTVFTQNRVTAGTPKLPESVKQYGVKTEKSMPNILMLVSLTADGRYGQNFLGNYALINIKDVLARIKGVGRVNVMGASDYSMRIWVKPDRLSQLGMTVTEIIAAVRAQNVTMPGGKFGAEPAPAGTEMTYTVRLPERLSSEEEFGDIVVRTNKDGSQVKVKDIARVELGVETYNMFPRMNGKEAAIVALYQAPGSNAVDLADQVRSEMERLSNDFPEGMRYDVTLDGAAPITAGIEEIVITLFVALLLVILVVFIFIQDWRATLIPTIAIPVSLIGTFMIFPLLGFTINVLSLLGLVLAIGIVVDDAIVVVEAVQVNIAKGMKTKEATQKAMAEVTAPVIATTLVLVAVFIPVAGMAGITGSLYQQFAITIAISVVFSSINALSLTPALCGILLKEPKPYKGVLGKFFAWFNKVFDKTTDSYMSFTNIVASKAKRGMVFIGIIAVGIVVLGKILPGGFIPSEDQGYFYINIQLPDGASLQRTLETSKQVEAIVSNYPEVKFVTTAAGFSLLSGSMAPNSGFMFANLHPWADRDKTAKMISQELNKQLYLGVNSAQTFSFEPPTIPGLGSGTGFTFMLQDKGGNTPEYLSEQADVFLAAANARPEIGSAFTTFKASVPQKFLDINRDKALKMGVDLNDLYTTIGAFLGGSYVNDFNKFGRLYKAYVQAEPEYRTDESKLSLFYIKNKDGEKVPLTTLVSVKEISGPEYTNRFNLLRSVQIQGGPAPGYTSTEAMDALEEVAADVLPSTMTYAWADMSFQEKKASGGAAAIFALSLIFVFLVLAAQYESWSLPLSILLGTPFAVFGAMAALYIARLFSDSFEMNVYAQISLVLLIAMAAKNAILIVEFANEAFENEGLSLYDSAIKAAKLRFRPILMTAFSFILGILPLVLASGAGAESRKVMGMALLGGMSVATLIGVFMTPLLFIVVGRLFKYEEKREAKLKALGVENE
ncbi:MAG: efflux RND transporter permease subunit [Flavobacteriales bacterium]|nr:efflux RND transporter permease subunit [Flavobacteriales bacterium]